MKEDRDDYDEENNIVELVDDEGNRVRYEHLMTFEHHGEWYCAFTPEKEASEEDGEGEDEEVAIYHLVGSEDSETLETIEDDALLEEVFAEFCDLWNSSEEDGED